MSTALWSALLRGADAGRGGFREFGPSGERRRLSLGQVRDEAVRLSRRIPTGGTGDRVVLALPNDVRFVVAFFAVLYAGMVPVPSPWAPAGPSRRRFRQILAKAHPRAVVLPSEGADQWIESEASSSPPIVTVGHADISDAPAAPRPPLDHVSTTAFVQFTSGSTADPKGIEVDDGNIEAVARQARAVYGDDENGCAVSWVPLFHDMGLVTGLLRPVLSGYESVLLAPADFVADPSLWLRAVSRYSASHTSAPNFGYDLCCRKVDQSGDLDLSSLVVARSAGEHVAARTLDQFAERFAQRGFASTSFCPSYGMAEATLTVTSVPIGAPWRTVLTERTMLADGRPQAEPSRGMSEHVLLGPPVPDTDLVVTDPSGEPVPDGTVGEIVIRGPQVTATALATSPREIGGHRYFRTGDHGFLSAGELVVVGRSAERISIRGTNHYASDIEGIVAAACPELRPGRIIVCADADPDRVAVTGEVRDATAGDLDVVAKRVRRSVATEAGIRVGQVAFVAPGTLPRTSSGKLRRLAWTTAGLDRASPALLFSAP